MPNLDENIQRASRLDTTALSDALDRLTEARRQLSYHQLQSKRH
jgi:hypothetical protein